MSTVSSANHPAPEEVLAGSNVDVRTVLHFQLATETVQALLPTNWDVDSPHSGPAAGANLRVTMIEAVAAYDAQGKPRPTVSYMHFGIPARRRGAVSGGVMLFMGLSPSAPGPYGTNLMAVANVERTIRHKTHGTAVDESWSFVAADDRSVTLRLSFARGQPARETAALHVFSRANPEFFRIYRYDQCIDVLGVPGASSRLQEFQFKAAGDSLAALFDGTERLISVVAVPSYVRQVFLPGRR